jgi:translation initiation factor 2 beta subunit (eIF-2beta)/eIF-5
MAGVHLCSSDVVSNFLLIAKMQQHDPAREPGLHSVASPKCFGQGPICLNSKSSFHLYQFYIEELKKNGANNPSDSLFLFILLGIKS